MPKKSAKDREEELRIWELTPLYITPEGLKELQEKLARLKRNMPEAIKEVARTAAYGDRSENAEYKAAKGRLRSMQRQIASIDDQLRKVKIIPSGPSATGKIQMGSVVKLEYKGKEITYRIVGPHEVDPDSGLISYLSPLGSALLDHSAGDVVLFESAAGKQEYKVLDIK